MGDFQKHCAQRRKYPVLLQIEFNNAVKEKELTAASVAAGGNSTRHGNRRNNQEKNQNPRIVPYDYNRVVLEPEEGIPDSDYVNASYVDVRSVFWDGQSFCADINKDRFVFPEFGAAQGVHRHPRPD